MMNNESPKKPLSVARKKCLAYFWGGLLVMALALEIPTVLARFHLGGVRFAERNEWRVLLLGLLMSSASAYIYLTKKDE